MRSTSPLLIDLAGVAELAGVQRPVASMWRKRFPESSADPFPQGLTTQDGRTFFDATAIAHWLSDTNHGNNPDAIADAAASAAPADFDIRHAEHVAVIDALLALRTASGAAVGDATNAELTQRANLLDPQDRSLRSEISSARQSWAHWADQLADAAYSSAKASQLLEQRHAARSLSAGSTGPLTAAGHELFLTLAEQIIANREASIVAGTGITPAFVSEVVARVGDDIDLAVSDSTSARRIRRRLLCEGVPVSEATGLPRTLMARLPSGDEKDAAAIVTALDEIVLDMRDDDRAIALGPASVLVDDVRQDVALSRSDVLRTGRVRAIVKLPSGLVTTAPREALALWVLGREVGTRPVAERVTAIADMSGLPLTAASRTDLASDIVAAMGSDREAAGHAFRFTRLVRTTSLLAARASLITTKAPRKGTGHAAHDLPALLDQARAELGEDAPVPAPSVVADDPLAPWEVRELLSERHLRVLPGTRLASDALSDSGLVVVSGDDLEHPQNIGSRRIDPMILAARYPSARLTTPGDIVFRTSPTAKAWVDPDGSKVVAYPARVLRINAQDPGGLVPELAASDIDGAPSGPSAWRRWQLNRVVPSAIGPLRAAIADIVARRDALNQRIEALDTYSTLLTTGVVAGVVTLPTPAAAAAPNL